MFKEKKETKTEIKQDSLWEDEEALNLHYLELKNLVNESQKTMGVIDNGEYEKTCSDINDCLTRMENRNGLDEIMGHPMEMLDALFEGIS